MSCFPPLCASAPMGGMICEYVGGINPWSKSNVTFSDSFDLYWLAPFRPGLIAEVGATDPVG